MIVIVRFHHHHHLIPIEDQKEKRDQVEGNLTLLIPIQILTLIDRGRGLGGKVEEVFQVRPIQDLDLDLQLGGDVIVGVDLLHLQAEVRAREMIDQEGGEIESKKVSSLSSSSIRFELL